MDIAEKNRLDMIAKCLVHGIQRFDRGLLPLRCGETYKEAINKQRELIKYWQKTLGEANYWERGGWDK